MGKHRPDAKIISSNKGWQAFRPQGDLFIKKAGALDLRHYNDKYAGVHGFLKRKRNGLVFNDGTKARFWGVNAYDILQMEEETVNFFVNQMAKYGVNLVRINGPLNPRHQKEFGPWDKKLLNRLHFLVSACKKKGIYVALALYNPGDYAVTGKMNLAGYDESKNIPPYGLLAANPDYRSRYKKWTRFL